MCFCGFLPYLRTGSTLTFRESPHSSPQQDEMFRRQKTQGKRKQPQFFIAFPANDRFFRCPPTVRPLRPESPSGFLSYPPVTGHIARYIYIGFLRCRSHHFGEYLIKKQEPTKLYRFRDTHSRDLHRKPPNRSEFFQIFQR